MKDTRALAIAELAELRAEIVQLHERMHPMNGDLSHTALNEAIKLVDRRLAELSRPLSIDLGGFEAFNKAVDDVVTDP